MKLDNYTEPKPAARRAAKKQAAPAPAKKALKRATTRFTAQEVTRWIPRGRASAP